MTDIKEVIRPEGVRGDERFCGLKLDNVDYAFQISEENTWNDDWVYRIYHFDSIQWKQIDKLEYLKIRDLCRRTAVLYNSNNLLSAELNTKDLLAIWKTHFS